MALTTTRSRYDGLAVPALAEEVESLRRSRDARLRKFAWGKSIADRLPTRNRWKRSGISSRPALLGRAWR
jgi:hypothetical protein